MKSYLADLRLLLEGCFGRLAGAFAYFAGSAAMDLVCMAILPAFVIFALAPDVRAQIALPGIPIIGDRSEEHTSELQSRLHLVCRLLLEKKTMTAVTIRVATM